MYILESTPVPYSIVPGRPKMYKRKSRCQIPDKKCKNPERDSTKRVDGKQKVISKTKIRHMNKPQGTRNSPRSAKHGSLATSSERGKKTYWDALVYLTQDLPGTKACKKARTKGSTKRSGSVGIRYRRFLFEPQSRAAGTIYLNLLQKKRVGET